MAHLYYDDGQHTGASWIHQTHVVVSQSLPAALGVQVELFCLVVVVVVGSVVGQVVLQAGPRGGGVAAAERNSIHQVSSIHITPDTTGDRWEVYNENHMM